MFHCISRIRLTKKCCNLKQFGNFSKKIEIGEEVMSALENGKPVVALESTIITHGMPFPENVQCAKEVEEIVRNQGAIPATVAIIEGKLKVGLTEKEIIQLGDTKSSKPIKTSRRDLPYVVSNKLNGGTTVSGTLIAANGVGIPIFATGGIGGVHRGAEETFDVSADLIELGKSNVAVVSSGVKSILDIPKTLEYLETQGVLVVTYGEDNEFPAFYSSKSGTKAPYFVKNAKEAAKIIQASRDLNLNSGMLFGVPVPEDFSLDPKQINETIEKALKIARVDLKISGKEVTPFLLAEIAKLTQGKSLKTNIALIKNNAKVAADIAVNLKDLQNDSKKPNCDSVPMIIGGSNMDVNVGLKTSDIQLDGRIYFGKYSSRAGGVARNLCDSLWKLGFASNFLTAVGNDTQGKFLKSTIPQECHAHVKTVPGHESGQMTIVFDNKGDCRLLIGNMDIHKKIDPELILDIENQIKTSPLIIFDGNLSLDAMETLLALAEKHNVPALYEPTDVEIAAKPFETNHWKALKFITPNYNELKFIASHLNISPKTKNDTLQEVAEISKQLVNFVDNVIVTLGTKGAIVARRGLACEPFLTSKNTEIFVRHYPVEVMENIVNVSGAGDCFASGVITGILSGLDEEICVSIGKAAAATALLSPSAIPKEIFDRSHESWKTKAAYISL